MPNIIYASDPKYTAKYISNLKRTVECGERYARALDYLRNKGISPELQILITEFASDSQNVAITKNNYPYHLEDGQEHCLVWVKDLKQLVETQTPCQILNENSPDIKIFVKEAIKTIFFSSFFKDSVLTIWENDESKKSVQGLAHFHGIIQTNNVTVSTPEELKKFFNNL